MNNDEIEQKKGEIVRRYGPWTAHNICLGDNIYTIDNCLVGDEIKLRRIVSIVSDISRMSLADLSVLDLACLEGLYSIELARHGSEVAAIEIRETNIEKVRFAKDVLSLDRLRLYCDDIRNLSREKHGSFDVVLCLGILYHLDAPDIFSFIEKMAEVCKMFAVIDTHISATTDTYHTYNNKTYWGKQYQEHSPDSTQEERLKSLWSSVDNVESFWPTRPSLYNMLMHAGFTSVYECHVPPETGKPSDRLTLVAIKGRKENLFSSHVLLQEDCPENFAVNSDMQASG